MMRTKNICDMQNTWKVFSQAMRKIGVSLKNFRVDALKSGDTLECTRLLRLVLLGISVEVADQIISMGHGQLSSDNKFINIVFRYLRDQSKYFPVITVSQYHGKGYGEHKLMLINTAATHVLGYLAMGGARVTVGHAVYSPEKYHGNKRGIFASSRMVSSNTSLVMDGDDEQYTRDAHRAGAASAENIPNSPMSTYEYTAPEASFDEYRINFPTDQVQIRSTAFVQTVEGREEHERDSAQFNPTANFPATQLEKRNQPSEESNTLNVEKMLFEMEQRIRGEYDAAILTLSDRITALEYELAR